MSISAKLMAAAAAACIATPSAAQYNPYPNQPGYNYPAYPGQQYPQQYPGQQYPGQAYPGQTYPGQEYPYGYNGTIGSMIDQLLGNRYNVTDRQAIGRCASAAMSQAQSQYGYRGYNGYGGYNGYSNYNNYGGARVTAITDVQRRSYGLRVSGLIGMGRHYDNGYGNRYGNAYGNGYRELNFRCDVDYRGVVTNLRVRHNDEYRRY
jgi:hypothetical protein